MDFDRLERALQKASYHGFLGCEYSPIGSTEAGLGWLRRNRSADLLGERSRDVLEVDPGQRHSWAR